MEITVMSMENIKPSSPTPPHFKHLKLSLIDQQMHHLCYNRIILFFSSQGDSRRFHDTNMSYRLKKSLSEVLTEYYPLAGGFNDSQSIVCNDDGLEYIEARVKAPFTLNQIVACPQSEDLDRLLPHDVYNYGTGFKGLSAVQVTIFDHCGGMAVGVSVSHLLTDGSSLATFINRWAAIARGGHTHTPAAEKFTFASFFPPRYIPPVDTLQGDTEGARKLVTKRFIFPQSKINTLKSKVQYQSPTRVQVVSALIFKCVINVRKRSSKSTTPAFPVDLRSRANPRLPTDYLGNMALLLLMGQIDPETSLDDLGARLGKSIKEIDNEYLKKLQANNASLLFEKFANITKFFMSNDAAGLMTLSSCCSFPFYEVDFGWGTPTMTAPVLRNHPCIVLYSKNRDGIEAWLTLEEDDMELFQADSEILEFTES